MIQLNYTQENGKPRLKPFRDGSNPLLDQETNNLQAYENQKTSQTSILDNKKSAYPTRN